MNVQQINDLCNEVVKNTLEFLSAEMRVQLSGKNFNDSENVSLLTCVVVNLFLNHVIVLSDLLEDEPKNILKLIALEEKIDEIMKNRKEENGK